MSDDLLERARGLWEGLAGGRFPDPGAVRVVENPGSRICPPGWAGIVRLAGAVLATAPTAAQAELLRRTIDPGALPVLDQLGPAQLAYTTDLQQAADPVEWAGEADLSELIDAVAPDEANGMLPQWRARIGASQRIAAKLGYRVLGEQLSLQLYA